ncbi:MAG: heparinase II/III family protein [Candidatus Hydrogenedentes bacterium]|nr:heparinase II/III family protein [Candidatus Hydrogenedentota bacterium]
MIDYLGKFLNILHSARYYKPSQLKWYFYYRVRNFLPISLWFSPNVPLEIQIEERKKESLRRYAKLWAEHISLKKEEIDSILEGRVKFAGEEFCLNESLEGTKVKISPLASYELHSFDFIWKLCIYYFQSFDERIEKFVKDCIVRWIELNPPGTPVSWDPYPTSFRIRYVLTAYSIWGWNDEQILHSVWLQLQYLTRSLELHLLGNHILQNLCGALVGAEVVSPEFKENLLKTLCIELEEQILEDGGHYERVPMYHFHVLCDLLWLLAVLDPMPLFIKETVIKMLKFGEGITLSDGNYPLFGDSVYEHLPRCEEILHVGYKLTGIVPQTNIPKKALKDFPHSGYYLFKCQTVGKRDIEMVIKGGEPGPYFQLAHAHSDQLSYELLVDGKRFVVDSGVDGYAGSKYRLFQRSSKAHNIIWIDGVDQLEAWGTFRVARRGRCEVEEVKTEPLFRFVGRYYYYTGERIKRTVELNYPFLSIKDEVMCRPDRRFVYNFVHFHPNVNVVLEDSGNNCIIATGYGIQVNLDIIGTDSVELVKGLRDYSQGWYSERFGYTVPNNVVVMLKRNTEHSKVLMFEYKFRFE